MPAYNAARHINTTIESIYSQTYTNFELIIVNDGSTDDTASICQALETKYENIIVIDQENQGPAAARNAGIIAAKGDYITFIDAEDTVDNNWLEIYADILTIQCYDLIICGYKRIRRNEKRNTKECDYIKTDNPMQIISNSQYIEAMNGLISDGIFNPLWNKIYKRVLLIEFGISLNSQYKLGEDFLFNIDYSEYVNSIFVSTKCPYNYYIDEGSITHRYHENKFVQLRDVTLRYKYFLDKHSIDKTQYFKRLMRNVFSSTMEFYHVDCMLTNKEKVIKTREIINDESVVELIALYKPNSFIDSLLLSILKPCSPKLVLVFSKIFHFGKFWIAPRIPSVR